MSRILSSPAVEAWKRRDPYLLDVEGFEKFLEYWVRMENEEGFVPNDEDAIPPCVQCVKDGISCMGDNVYRTGGEALKIKIVAPHSHIWKPLKRPRKGTLCENCGSERDLMAYRGPYNSQTVCAGCLQAAREGGYTRSKLVCDHIVYRRPGDYQKLHYWSS